MTSLPGVLNLSMYAGDTFSQEMAFSDDNDTPINLTGATVTAQWRSVGSSATSVAFTVVVDNAAAGEVTVSLTATATAELKSGVWDLQMSAAGVVSTLVGGSVTVYPQVTRS